MSTLQHVEPCPACGGPLVSKWWHSRGEAYKTPAICCACGEGCDPGAEAMSRIVQADAAYEAGRLEKI